MRSRALPLLLAAVVVGAAFLGLAAPARAFGLPPVYGFETSSGHFVLPFVQGLITVDPVSPGSTVFGDTLYLEITPNGRNESVHITSKQTGNGNALWYNATFAVSAVNVTIATFNLPPSTDQRDTRLCADGGCLSFVHLTPVTLIPSGILNIGGLDLLVFSIVALCALLTFPLLVLARYVGRKALWTPKFHAWLFAIHILSPAIYIILVDYRAFDAVFGGLGFLLFPFVYAILLFLWAMHLFNVARPTEVFRPDFQGGHRLRYNRWRIWVGDLSDGRKILVGTRWRDWLARLYGHFPVLVTPDVVRTREGPPVEIPLRTLRAETRDEKLTRKERLLARRFRARWGKESPLDDFEVTGGPDHREKDAPTHLYWVDSDRWLSADMPRLSWHRDVFVPAKTAPDGTVVTPSSVKTKLSWPHYVDPPAVTSLAGFHYLDAPVAAMLAHTNERAYHRVEEIHMDNVAMNATVFDEADRLGELQVAETYRLFTRERLPLSDEEAEEETRREAPKAKDEGATLKDADASSRPKGPSERRVEGGGA
jgi:hypothetical protein